MNRSDKLVERFKAEPTDFTWDEMVRLLSQLGFDEVRGGRTGGSRRRFIHKEAGIITLHRPHPSNIVKRYAIRQVKSKLESEGLI